MKQFFKKALVGTALTSTLLLSVGGHASAKLVSQPTITDTTSSSSYIDSKEGVTTAKTTVKYHKFYDGSKFKMDDLNVEELTEDKYLQKTIKREAAGVVKEYVGSEGYSKYKKQFKAKTHKNIKIKVKYRVTRNSKNVLSIRALYYYANTSKKSPHESFIASANLNYNKNYKKTNEIKLSIDEVLKDEKALNKYLQAETKKQYEYSAPYPKYSIYPEYYDKDGSVVVDYAPSELGKKESYYTSYLIRVPAKFFDYDKLKK